MNTIENMMTRTSVRRYTDQPVSDEDILTILKAGQSGPSCVNARDWHFIVIKDKERLIEMADANGGPAEPLRYAAFAIMVCGDLDKAFKGAPDYWVIDGAIAGQNMILAAHELGLGSVWLGTYPQMRRVDNQKELFKLPENLIPHSIFAFGYPAENPPVKGPELDESCITWC